MGGITRRSSTFPDAATLTAIEGVFIVDEAPMGAVQGSPSGTVCFVGEYEDGGFATDPAQPADVFHPPGGPIAVPRDKWAERVGTLGYSFQGVRNQFPCARRSLGEWWNGNAYVQAKDLAFRAFYGMRVETSVGALTFAPLAFVESGTVGPWALTSGQTLVVAVDGGATATAAVTGAGGTFALTAGAQLTLSLDGATAVTTTFAATDTTIDLAAARINATFGSTVTSNVGGQLRLASPTRGSSSRVQVVSATAGALAKLGLATGTTPLAPLGHVRDALVPIGADAGLGRGRHRAERGADGRREDRFAAVAPPPGDGRRHVRGDCRRRDRCARTRPPSRACPCSSTVAVDRAGRNRRGGSPSIGAHSRSR